MKLQNHALLLMIVLLTGFILFAGCTGENSESTQKGKIIGIELVRAHPKD